MDPRPNQALGARVLFVNDPRRGRIVAAANATARARGVVPAMTLTQMGTMCPEATWTEHDPQADLEEIVSLAEQLQQFSPVVGLEQLGKTLWAGRSLHQPQAIFIDVTGTSAWFGGEQAMARAIHTWCSERRWITCIGLASSLGSAWAMANYAFRDRIASAMESVESGLSQPASHVWIRISEDDADTHAELAGYPIEALRVELAVVAKLHRLGIRRVDALMRLPRASLTARFGPELLVRIDQCLGDRLEPIRSQQIELELATSLTWEHPIANIPFLSQRVDEATRDVCQRLQHIGHGALRLVCRLELERQSIDMDAPVGSRDCAAHIMQLSLFQASNDPEHIAWLFLGQLELSPPRMGSDIAVRSLRMEVHQSAPLQWRQNELFEEVNVKYQSAIARLIDSLSARLGRNQVLAPSVVRDPLPELQVRMRPLTGLRTDGRAQETKRKLSRAPKRDFANESSMETPEEAHFSRPSRLLSSPLLIEVEVSKLGEPATVRCRNDIWKVLRTAGPERVESGWWSGPSHRRDYFRIILESGDWWWIFLDLKSKRWFLHGGLD